MMRPFATSCLAVFATACLCLCLTPPAGAQDMPLSQVLIEGEDWQVVTEGHGFTDALCADGEGNLYFSDVKNGVAIIKVDLEGKAAPFITDAAGISGLKWGADGRLYACAARGRRVLAFSREGVPTTLAEGVQPNDLVVTHDGNVYFTMTPTNEVVRLAPNGEKSVVSTGVILKPNGIALSRDQGTLAVSEYGGTHVWAFRIEANGSLAFGERYMTLRAPNASPDVAKGDGMAADIHGRWYVTSEEGLQMFDPTGRMGGVIAKPQQAPLVSMAFAGPGHEWLHVACGDKVYKRRTKTKGTLSFQPPQAPEKAPK